MRLETVLYSVARKRRALMEDLVKLGQVFVQVMRDRRGIAQVDEIYAENAQSVEAVVPPGRDVRIAKGRGAIKAKREDWLATTTFTSSKRTGLISTHLTDLESASRSR
jgi:hypothetical protein